MHIDTVMSTHVGSAAAGRGGVGKRFHLKWSRGRPPILTREAHRLSAKDAQPLTAAPDTPPETRFPAPA